jgi:hypothetical protein
VSACDSIFAGLGVHALMPDACFPPFQYSCPLLHLFVTLALDHFGCYHTSWCHLCQLHISAHGGSTQLPLIVWSAVLRVRSKQTSYVCCGSLLFRHPITLIDITLTCASLTKHIYQLYDSPGRWRALVRPHQALRVGQIQLSFPVIMLPSSHRSS